MCGIFGAISWDKPVVDQLKSDFERRTNLINHRGPDHTGFEIYNFQSFNNSNNGGIFFGHTRLSILDLDPRSNQPFSIEDLDIIFNGEIFNFKELTAQHLPHISLRTTSDTEVILHLYKKLGTKCFELFNGMWALMILDKKQNKIIVSRDRFSIKPLFYKRTNEGIIFGSELKQLRNFGQDIINIRIIKHFLNQSLLNFDNETFYENIFRFPAKSFMTIDLNTRKEVTEEYWDYERKEANINLGDAKTEFRRLLIDSLNLRLISDVPVGCMLSGGLDSSAITSLIKQHLNSDIRSFSVVSDEKKYSEESFVDILVNSQNIANTKLSFKSDLALDNIDNILTNHDAPFGSLSVVAQSLLFKKIKEETGIKVLLSGQGADESLMGYKKFYFFYLKKLLREKKLIKFSKNTFGSLINRTTITDLNFTDAKRYMPGKTNKGRSFFTCDFEDEDLWSFTSLQERQIMDMEKYSIPVLTHVEDINAMEHGIEVRLPFLDYRLVNFLVSLPTEIKIHNGWNKFILRHSIDELPKEIRWRRDKKGFVTPEEEWIKGELGDHIINFMKMNKNLEGLGILNNEQFIKGVVDFRKGNKWLNHGDIFRVFITEKWLATL